MHAAKLNPFLDGELCVCRSGTAISASLWNAIVG